MAQRRVFNGAGYASGHAAQVQIVDEFHGWRTIPEFPDYEMTQESDIRLKPGRHRSLYVTYRGPYVRLWKQGKLYTKRLDMLFAQAWPIYVPREVPVEWDARTIDNIESENKIFFGEITQDDLKEAGIFMSKAKAVRINAETRKFVAERTGMAEWELELINGFYMITDYIDGVRFSIMRESAFHSIFNLSNDEDIKRIDTELVEVKGKWEK